MGFNIEFYEKENGEKPAKEFLISLDVKMRAYHIYARFCKENSKDATFGDIKSQRIQSRLFAEKGA